MINCPKCNKEIADESAHCGYCGQEIKAQAEKKTMFGMAALDSDMLKKAVEEAREAKKEGGQPAKGLKIPAPGAKNTSAAPAGSGAPSKPKLPQPGQSQSASRAPGSPVDDSDYQTSADAADDISLAQTEMLSFSPEDREELANLSAGQASNETAPIEEPRFGEAPTLMGSPDEPLWGGQSDGSAGFGEEATAPHDTPTMDTERDMAPAGQSAPVVGGFSQHGGDQQVVPAPQTPAAPEKSKTGLIIAIAAVVMLLGGGCFVGVAWYAYSAFAG